MSESRFTTINIFIVSSIVRLKTQRQELSNFVRMLNGSTEELGIHLNSILCEELSDAVVCGERKQDEINEVIRECRYFYALVDSVPVGDITAEEISVAYDLCRQTGSPEIHILIGRETISCKSDEEVLEIYGQLNRQLDLHEHYFTEYEVLSDIKLNIVMALNRVLPKLAITSISNGQAKINGADVGIDLKDVSPYRSLRERELEIEALENELQEKGALLAKGDISVAAQIGDLSQAIEKKRGELDEMGSAFIVLCKELYGNPEGNRSVWHEKAMRLAKQGDFDAAIDTLVSEKRKQQLHDAEAAEDALRDYLSQHISDNTTLIALIQARRFDEESYLLIIDVFEESAEIARKHLVCVETLYDYAKFLFDHRLFSVQFDWKPRLESLLNEAQAAYELAADVSRAARADLLVLKGKFARHVIGDFKSSEKSFLEAIALFEEYEEASADDSELMDLVDRRPKSERELHALVSAHNALGNLLRVSNRIDESERHYLLALKLRKLYKNDDTEPDCHETAIRNNLALLYVRSKRYPEAEKLHKQNLEEREALAKVNPEQLAHINPEGYGHVLSLSLNALAETCFFLGDIDRARALLDEALDNDRTHAKETPEKYDADVAHTLYNYGRFLKRLGKHEEARAAFREALSIDERLAENNPTKIAPYQKKIEAELADICC